LELRIDGKVRAKMDFMCRVLERRKALYFQDWMTGHQPKPPRSPDKYNAWKQVSWGSEMGYLCISAAQQYFEPILKHPNGRKSKMRAN